MYVQAEPQSSLAAGVQSESVLDRLPQKGWVTISGAVGSRCTCLAAAVVASADRSPRNLLPIASPLKALEVGRTGTWTRDPQHVVPSPYTQTPGAGGLRGGGGRRRGQPWW